LPAAAADVPDAFGAAALLVEPARMGVLVKFVLGEVVDAAALVEAVLVESAMDGAAGAGATVVWADP
jgi:hypothetical protein